jgi:putative phosphoesterase
MKVLVISDTHIPHRASLLPKEFYERVDEVDLIIHAGDFTTLRVFRELESFKPTLGVVGNMDEPELYSILPEIRVELIENLRVGIFHGVGSPIGLEKRVREKFRRENLEVDLIIFGHSHRWFYGEVDGVKMLNPGSATDTFFSFKRSFAILSVEGKNFDVEKVEVSP